MNKHRPRNKGERSPVFEEADDYKSRQNSQFADSEYASLFGIADAINESVEDPFDRMGQAFVNANKLTQEEVTRIVQLQQRKRIRFGEAAIHLGLLTEDDVHEVLAQQFNYQTTVKPGKGSRKKVSSRLLISHSPHSPEAEAIRRFRAELLLRIEDNECLVIALFSANSHEGKSHLCASLAIAFSQLNIKTLLIDANLRKPAQHNFFHLQNSTGLSTMLAGRTLHTLDLSHQITNHLSVLTAGPKPPNPSEILSAPNLTDLLEKFRSEVKIIIIDTPPTSVGPDAQIIGPQAGNTVLVCRKDQTSTEELRKAFRNMESTSAKIIGTFLNHIPDEFDPQKGQLRKWFSKLFRFSSHKN